MSKLVKVEMTLFYGSASWMPVTFAHDEIDQITIYNPKKELIIRQDEEYENLIPDRVSLRTKKTKDKVKLQKYQEVVKHLPVDELRVFTEEGETIYYLTEELEDDPKEIQDARINPSGELLFLCFPPKKNK